LASRHAYNLTLGLTYEVTYSMKFEKKSSIARADIYSRQTYVLTVRLTEGYMGLTSVFYMLAKG
jgi:hypothetical protein